MKKYKSDLRFLWFIPFIYYLFHFLFFWVFESTDSYFYWAFSDFIKTGRYFVPSPYNYNAPSTMEPPLYSLFLYLAQYLPRADIIVHLVQISSIFISAIFIYKIFKHYASKNISTIISIIFLLTPSHAIYISNLVAEPIAIFFITFYLYLVHKILNEKRIHLIPWLLVLSSFMSLQRYNLIVFYGFALYLILIYGSCRSRISDSSTIGGVMASLRSACHPRGVFSFFISIFILVSWILINHRLNGSWGLSNAEGKHLYNRIFHFDRMLPRDDDASFIKFKKIIGENKDYFKPWWFYEPDLLSHFNQSETKSSQLMQDVSLAALKNNPLKYFSDTPPFFLFAHNSNPTYHDKLYLWNEGQSTSCRTLGTISLCKPIINLDFNRKVWDTSVKLIDNYYLNLAKYVNFFILFPALVWSFFQKDRYMKFVAFLYIISILFFVAFEAPLPRYTYIFTPLKTILAAYLLLNLGKYYHVRKT